jgi:prophage regulatory protein
MHSDNDNSPRLISMKETARQTSLSRTMINRYRGEGRFPVAVSLGERRVAFVRAEVQAWIDNHIAARAAT